METIWKDLCIVTVIRQRHILLNVHIKRTILSVFIYPINWFKTNAVKFDWMGQISMFSIFGRLHDIKYVFHELLNRGIRCLMNI